VRDGHHMINRSNEIAVCLDIGSRWANDICSYPDIDLHADQDDYSHKDGQPYPRRG